MGSRTMSGARRTNERSAEIIADISPLDRDVNSDETYRFTPMCPLGDSEKWRLRGLLPGIRGDVTHISCSAQ